MDGEQISGFSAERAARDRLEKELHVKFATARAERTLIIGYRSTGEPIKHEFDLVSHDGRIIGEIKSDKYTLKAHSHTRLPRMLAACRYLELVPAQRKLFILTDKHMYEVLKHDLDGMIDKQIEVLYIDIQPDRSD